MTETAYSSEQFEAAYPPGIETHFWYYARNRIILRQLRLLCGDGDPGRVLEIGTGAGVVLAFLRENGIDCRGVEPSTVRLAADLEPYVQTNIDCFELAATVREEVDYLLLLDVLEHIPEPNAFLSQLRVAFRNARAIIITVPARPELWSNFDVYNGHHRRYTLATLDAEARAAGFRSVRAGYMFHALYPVMLVLAKLFGARTVKVPSPRPRIIHRLMGACCVIEQRAMPSSLWGTSLLAIIAPEGVERAG